jgi:hypothetical protein
MSNELDRLRDEFPGWVISDHWVTLGTGPDFYMIHAENGETVVNASTPAELETLIRGAEVEDVEYVATDVLDAKPEHVFTVRRVLRHYRSGEMSPRVALAQLRAVQ